MFINVPGYHLREILEENTVFRIYRGQRLQDDLPIRLKVLNQPYPTPKILAPLLQEFEILKGLDIPGVEKAYALENHRQWWMIVLEDFGGRPLDKLEIAGKMEPEEFLNLALQLADTVKEIHARQVIHKKISPSNISFNLSTRQTRFTNFGNASLISRKKVPVRSLHQQTEILAYISPEMTGRMNRSVDYRTDYYSLGATLYELLTGKPPFPGESPLELFYAHLAISPEPPASRIEPWRSFPTAFQIISAILLKLLAKNPEDRYQTPGSLLADLRQCQDALQNPVEKGSEKPEFLPGIADHPAGLNIPQIVIGRERDTEELLQAFLRTIDRPVELVLVSGEAGVGKTALVNQLLRPVAERMGLFLYAAYDPNRPMIIYQGLEKVLEEFCWLILSEPTLSFEAWRERIQAEVAPHGQLLIDLCPQLEKIIGPQPPVDPVDESLARPRLHQVVIRFLQAVCRPEHPVVILLDDLQGISPDSSLLWQSILSTPSIQNLLVVGAYRDNEVGPEHPIHKLVNEVRTTQGRVVQIQLQKLEWSKILRLVAAALASDPADISDLATLVYLRTEGNPYFSIEFLKSLYKDQLMAFDLVEQKWSWDANRIEEYGVASNVVDLFVHEITDLDEDTQKMLQLAACIGRRFDAATLLALLGPDKARSLADSLWAAMTEGLIQPVDENYRFLAGENTDDASEESGDDLPSLTDLLAEEILFEFQHNRVHQAVLAMLDIQQLRKTYLQIAWLMLEKAERTGQEAVREALIAIVDRLNAGSALVDDPAEAIKAAQLNLMASSQARAAAMFEAASSYLSTGMQFLPPDSWQNHYSLTLELFTAGAEVAMLNGDLARAESLALEAEANARTLLEKARFIETRMNIYLVQNQPTRVIELGIAAIEMLGFDLDREEAPVFFDVERYQLLPEMTDPRALAVSRLAYPLLSAAFISIEARFVQIILFFIDLFTRLGIPPGASFIFIVYGTILIGKYELVEHGCRMGKMALEMAEKGGYSKTLSAVRFVYYAYIHHWFEPAREGLISLYENIRPAADAGNLLFSLNTQDMEALNSLLVGLKLDQVRAKQAEARRRLEILHQVRLTHRLKVWSLVVSKLTGEPFHSIKTNSDLFGEIQEQALREIGQNRNFLFNLYTAQAFLSLLFREPQRSVEKATSADALKLNARAQLIYAHHHFIYSLALLSAGLDDSDLNARLEKVEENLRLMRLWASFVPENFLHQLELVEAEKARCLGQVEEAADSYERAIQEARKNGYIHESALAAELAAEFFLSREDYPAAIDYLFTAYYSYLGWGAAAKVDDLENRYPEWLPPVRQGEKKGNHHLTVADHLTDEIGSSIDLNTILKASLELAQETGLEELLRKLMSILIENAGAQNGTLVLWLDDRWSLEVQGSTDPAQNFALLSIPLEDQADQAGAPLVPISVIHYVINSQVDLVLKDASASRQFSQDPYIQSRRPKSILCAPLLNQGVLSGVVYLENNLTARAFTADRLEIVRLISGQAAVSIEKARLYENLEALVDERTRELSEANTKLKAEIDERIRVEEALRLSEERYRAVFENTGTAMALVDQEGNIALTNEEFVRLTGYPREELENHFQSLDLVAPSDASRIYQYRQDRLNDPSLATNSYEFQLVDHLGTEKSILNTVTFLPGSNTTILSWIDISQRKQAELELQIAMQELTEAEEELRNQYEELFTALQELSAAQQAIETERQRYRDLFDFAPDAYLVTNLDGKIFEVNHAAGSLLGLDVEKLAGKQLYNFLMVEDRRVFRARLAEMAAEKAAEKETREEPSGEKGGRRDWEVRLKKRDGSQIDASIAVAAVSGDQEEPVSLRWLVRDISARKRAERALRESEERLRSITENAPDFIAELDLQGCFLYVNRALAGYLPEDMAGVSLFDTIAEEYRAEVKDIFELAYSSSEMQSAEFKQTLTDGTERWQAARFATVTGPGGVERIILISTDVTAQKGIEKKLREAEEFTRATLNSLSEHIAILDEDGMILWVNRAWEKFSRDNCGDPAKTGVGVNYLQVCDLAAGQEAEVGRKFAEGIRATLTGKAETFELEYACPSEEDARWFIGRVTIFFMGDARRVVVAHDDITQIKQYELALTKSEALYRAIINTQTELVCRYLPDTTLTFVNEAYCRFTGKTAGELVGQSFLISIPEENHEFIQKTVSMMVEHPGTQEFEQRVISPSGELRWQRWVHSPIIENGNVVEFQAVGIDITERKLAEEALHYNEALLRKVLEILPVGIWITDTNHKIITGNPEGLRIWNGKSFEGIEEDGEFRAWRVETGKRVGPEEWAGMLALTEGQVTLNEELEIEAFDGTHRIILNSAMPIITEEDGLVGAIIVNQDITRRKHDEEELQKAHDQLSTLLSISQTILSMLDLDYLLNVIIEQLGKVLPYEAAAILILEQSSLEFRVIRGPSFLHGLAKYKVPISEPTLVEPLIKGKEPFYIQDLQNETDLLLKIQDTIKIPYTQFTFLRSWLGLPLIVKDVLVGLLVLAHSQPDYYSQPSRIVSQAFANQVAIAINNAQLYERAHEIAALEERNRLARELHDSVAQALYSISLFTDATRMALSTNKLDIVKQHLGELVELSREAMSDMRLMIFELRPPVLEKDGLAAALQSRLDSVEARAGFQAFFHSEGYYSLSTEEESELYRIAQEALNNVIKHAHADRVNVQLIGEAGSFKMTIKDNGAGFDPDAARREGGQGIRNILERAEGIGAACWIESAPGQGTKITIEVIR